MTVRVLEAVGELRAATDLFRAALLFAATDDPAWERAAALLAPGRTLGVHVGGEVVATAAAFPSRLAVPGGAVLPMAAVTRVGVRADHTRRGLLTALMRAQLADVARRGEPVATLRASEARIYGRFGYGVGTRGRELRVHRSGAGWRADAGSGGAVRVLTGDAVLDTVTAVHDSIALRRPGGMTRPDGWWQGGLGHRLTEPEHLLVAVHAGPDGDDGFAVATVADGPDFTRRPLSVADLHAGDAAAAAGLWRFLLDVDLTGEVATDLRPLDEPLELLLADPRDCVVTGHRDETWLRLVDVPAALAARCFPVGPAVVEPVLLAVHDTLLAANAGVYRIGDGPAERVAPPGGAAAHLECGVDALAMAYLGDRPPSALAATGWWCVHDVAALARADALFATPASPWCGTWF